MLHPALSPSFLEKAISKGEARGRSGLGSYRLQETFGQNKKNEDILQYTTHICKSSPSAGWGASDFSELNGLNGVFLYMPHNIPQLFLSLLQPLVQNLRKLLTKQVCSVLN